MKPTDFRQANADFGPPVGMDETECGSLRAYVGEIVEGNWDGLPLIVTCWKPSPEEVAAIVGGSPVYLSFFSSVLPPHCATTEFPFK